jgi:hypothetical protein
MREREQATKDRVILRRASVLGRGPVRRSVLEPGAKA